MFSHLDKSTSTQDQSMTVSPFTLSSRANHERDKRAREERKHQQKLATI